MNIFALILTSLSVLVPLISIGAAFYSLRRKRRFVPTTGHIDSESSCAIILPCKGNSPYLEDNIRSFFTLDHSNYEVVFTVESESDSAIPIINTVLKDHSNGRIVIAGIAEKSGQKNHNLVAAVDTITNADILIFADSDIRLFPEWISRMTRPLMDNSVTAVTGFRWLYPTDTHIGALAHSLQNFLLFSLFCTANYKANTGLWGGSMAISRENYNRLNVRDTWLKTSVDDMSLSEILKREGETTLFAYDCITPTNDTIKSLKNATLWFERQVMYLKAHQRKEWYAAQVAAFSFLGSYPLLIHAIIKTFQGGDFLLSGGVAWVLQTLLVVFFTLLFPVFGQKGKWKSFIIASPISFASAAIGTIRTLFTNKITWSGFRYTIRFRDGLVTNVERLQQ